MNCPRGFTNVDEINEKFFDDNNSCNKCDNLKYDNGILMCGLLLNQFANDSKKSNN